MEIIGGPGGSVNFPHGLAALAADRIRLEVVDNKQRSVVAGQHVSQFNIYSKRYRLTRQKVAKWDFPAFPRTAPAKVVVTISRRNLRR
jgi:hypothetical protein